MQKDHEFINDTEYKSLHKPKKFSHIILWMTAIFIIGGVVWANFAEIDIVTHALGKVIPSSRVQVIQNLEGGIVKAIYVKEGEMVKKGQVLMQMDPTRFQAAYDEDHQKLLSLKAKIARLQAEANGAPFVAPTELTQAIPDVVTNETALFNSRKQQIIQLQNNLNLANKELGMTKPLVASGAASDVDLIRIQRQVADLQGQIDDFKSKTLADLSETKNQFDTTNADMIANLDRLKRTTIVSPVKGIVQQIKINTLGGVSQPGAELMNIVPLDDTLLIEAQVTPKDIGFLHIGQTAQVKISAYDYSIYGGLEGKVETISADTVANEKDENFYLVRVRTQKNYLRTKDNPLYIIPGMTAIVDILTGKQTVLHYLLKPIFKARDSALRER